MSEKLRAAQATVGGHMDAIAGVFLPGAKVTVIVRNPDGENVPGAQDFMMTSDSLDEVAGVLRRRILGDSLATAQIAVALAPAREQGLKVEIIDGRLNVSIGVDALMIAVKGGPTWTDQEEEERGWKITSDDGFAADIAHELQDEEEDGTTLVHIMFDAAIERAIEQGSLNIDFGEDDAPAEVDGYLAIDHGIHDDEKDGAAFFEGKSA